MSAPVVWPLQVAVVSDMISQPARLASGTPLARMPWAPLLASAAFGQTSIVLRAARLLDVESGKMLKPGEVLVTGERIVEVGATVTHPPAAEIVDWPPDAFTEEGEAASPMIAGLGDCATAGSEVEHERPGREAGIADELFCEGATTKCVATARPRLR